MVQWENGPSNMSFLEHLLVIFHWTHDDGRKAIFSNQTTATLQPSDERAVMTFTFCGFGFLSASVLGVMDGSQKKSSPRGITYVGPWLAMWNTPSKVSPSQPIVIKWRDPHGASYFQRPFKQGLFIHPKKWSGKGPADSWMAWPGVDLDKLSPGNSIQRSKSNSRSFFISLVSNRSDLKGHLISSSKNTQQNVQLQTDEKLVPLSIYNPSSGVGIQKNIFNCHSSQDPA